LSDRVGPPPRGVPGVTGSAKERDNRSDTPAGAWAGVERACVGARRRSPDPCLQSRDEHACISAATGRGPGVGVASLASTAALAAGTDLARVQVAAGGDHVHHDQLRGGTAVPAVLDGNRTACGGLVLGPLLWSHPRPVPDPTGPLVRLVREQRAGPTGRDPAGPCGALHPGSWTSGPDGLLCEHDDARCSGLLPVRAHRRHHPGQPGRVRPAPAPRAWTGWS
jgi:hypothetical protein